MDTAPADALSAQDVPDFTGPYASDFRDAYSRTTSDKARQILATGKITEADFSEIQEDNRICLESRGFTEVEHGALGGMSYRQPEGVDDNAMWGLVESCSDESGLTEIEVLYGAMLMNPNNEDWDELTVQCLIDRGLVEPSFTVADLNAWYDNQDPRTRSGTPEQACSYDPLGRLSGQG